MSTESIFWIGPRILSKYMCQFIMIYFGDSWVLVIHTQYAHTLPTTKVTFQLLRATTSYYHQMLFQATRVPLATYYRLFTKRYSNSHVVLRREWKYPNNIVPTSSTSLSPLILLFSGSLILNLLLKPPSSASLVLSPLFFFAFWHPQLALPLTRSVCHNGV